MSTEKMDWRNTFLQLYQRLAHHYGAAFLRSSTEEQHKGHANHWQRSLHDERIQSDEMLAVFEAVIRTQRFRTFPPNPAEFVGFVYKERARRDFNIPESDEAFKQACGQTQVVHPLVAHVRNEIGGWYLRSRADAHMRTRFISLYEEAAESLARGKLTLAAVKEQDVPVEDTLSPQELAARLDRLISPQP